MAVSNIYECALIRDNRTCRNDRFDLIIVAASDSFREGVSRGPFKVALIARENAPAGALGAWFRHSSLGVSAASSSNSGWIFAAVNINPFEIAAADKRLCRRHFTVPR